MNQATGWPQAKKVFVLTYSPRVYRCKHMLIHRKCYHSRKTGFEQHALITYNVNLPSLNPPLRLREPDNKPICCYQRYGRPLEPTSAMRCGRCQTNRDRCPLSFTPVPTPPAASTKMYFDARSDRYARRVD